MKTIKLLSVITVVVAIGAFILSTQNFNRPMKAESNMDPPVHFLISDKQGDAAIIEYVEKDIKITRHNNVVIGI